MDRRGALAYLPMQDERAIAAAQVIPEEVRFTTFHLVTAAGAGYSGGAAVVETLVAIPWLSRLGKLLAARGLRSLVDVFYRALVASKGWLGRFVRDAPGPVEWP